MKWFYKISLLFLGLPMLFVACTNLKQPANKIEYLTLEYSNPRIDDLKPLPHVIQMDRFMVAPAYNTSQIIYRDRSFKRNAYIYYRWQSNPGSLVTALLNRDIKDSGLFKAVLNPGSRFSSSFLIEGTVDEFFEWDSKDNWKSILSLSVILIKKHRTDISNNVLFQKTYRKSEACTQKKPEAVAEAMSRALSKISTEMIKDIYDCLQEHTIHEGNDNS